MAGVGYAAALCWASVCLLASFQPDRLSNPYWSGIPQLRSDTSGIAAFVLAALCLCGSEYLRWRRRAAAECLPGGQRPASPLARRRREAGADAQRTMPAAPAQRLGNLGAAVLRAGRLPVGQ